MIVLKGLQFSNLTCNILLLYAINIVLQCIKDHLQKEMLYTKLTCILKC